MKRYAMIFNGCGVIATDAGVLAALVRDMQRAAEVCAQAASRP